MVPSDSGAVGRLSRYLVELVSETNGLSLDDTLELFRVLVPTTSAERLQNLKKTVAGTGADMFWFGLLEDLTPQALFQPRWWKVGTDQPRALLEF